MSEKQPRYSLFQVVNCLDTSASGFMRPVIIVNRREGGFVSRDPWEYLIGSFDANAGWLVKVVGESLLLR